MSAQANGLPPGRHLALTDARVCCYEAGEGATPVVLLHGGGTDSARLSWGPTVERLAPFHRVVTWDWPGYGESPLPSWPVTLPRLIDCLEQLRTALGLDRMHLAGISMGGGAALGYALESPRHVASLTLVSSYGLQPHAPWHHVAGIMLWVPGLMSASWAMLGWDRGMARRAIAAIFHDADAVSPALVDAVHEEIRRPHAGKAMLQFQRDELRFGGLRSDYRSRLGELRVPTLMLHGREDPLVPVASVIEAARKTHGARLEIIDDCGHWPQREHPGAFHEALGSFISERVAAEQGQLDRGPDAENEGR